jgi:hypothetical protein
MGVNITPSEGHITATRARSAPYQHSARLNLPINSDSKKRVVTLLRRRYFCCLAGAVGEHMFELRGDADFS